MTLYFKWFGVSYKKGRGRWIRASLEHSMGDLLKWKGKLRTSGKWQNWSVDTKAENTTCVARDEPAINSSSFPHYGCEGTFQGMPGGKRLNNINALHLCNSQPFTANDITVSVLVYTDDPLVPAHVSKALDRGQFPHHTSSCPRRQALGTVQ